MKPYHSLAYAFHAEKIDPLLVMHHTRLVRTQIAEANRLRADAYRKARERSCKPATLPRDIRTVPAQSNVHPLFADMFQRMGLAA